MVGAALRARPFSLAQLQPSVDIPTMAAPFRRWGKAVNLNVVLTGPCALVFQLAIELTDGGIRKVVGQVLILNHTFHIQVLHAYRRRLVLVGKIVCQFMDVVGALVGNVLM